MKKTSIASLQERLAGWLPWDEAMYQIGACLGFWPEYGAPHDNDPWHGTKDVFYTREHELGAILGFFLDELADEGCLEMKTVLNDRNVPMAHYRWNPSYKGVADITTMLK